MVDANSPPVPRAKQVENWTRSTFNGAMDGRVRSARPVDKNARARTRPSISAGGMRVYVQPTEPMGVPIGTLWYDTSIASSSGSGGGFM